ncbi:alpha-L-arabinofuranosidase [Bradyrhizobium sp. CIR48]|uniref:hypothetical protein n=1 Tax=Bradyrhizobium sp. CIR48 TaxID=2663840 RepID=UPI001605880C|nr:hypothetical protein [Bradyrhizobium sp. CIR48]MBB4423678.1 alpha-L-arabinofuranosidase [Bradyrhizobium sp. CIR48]
MAWFSTEPNSFGTNEFTGWCTAADVAPMIAVNRGTRGGDAARNLVEILQPSRRNCVVGAPPQARLEDDLMGSSCGASAMRWRALADRAKQCRRLRGSCKRGGQMMRRVDHTIELAVCGSSLRNMPSFGQWEETVLKHSFDYVDYISIHTYLENYSHSASFLASTDVMDGFIDEVVVLADAVAAKRRSKKRLVLSFDEWNVWYRTRNEVAPAVDRWSMAPPILEELYTMEDALASGGACIPC